jgi:hypothetical protein
VALQIGPWASCKHDRGGDGSAVRASPTPRGPG